MVLVTDVPTILETVLEEMFVTQMLPEGSLVIPRGLLPTAMVLVTDVPTILETVLEAMSVTQIAIIYSPTLE